MTMSVSYSGEKLSVCLIELKVNPTRIRDKDGMRESMNSLLREGKVN